MDKKKNHKEEEEEKNSVDDAEIDEDSKREQSANYDRKTKKKDPEKLKAIFSSSLEHSMIPEDIKPNPEVPEEEFEVEYVYGFRTFDARQNLRYNAKGQPVFMAAALGVILDQEKNEMKVFGGIETPMVAKNVADESKCHMDDILALDVSTDRKLVATGQVGKTPSVHIWDAETGEQKGTFKLKEGARGVQTIAISPCQRYVACTDMHNDHHLIIYNIKKNKLILQIEGSKEKLINIAWSKKPDDLRFCTIGVREFKFWNPADASKKLSSRGYFGRDKGFKQTTFTCVTFDTDGLAYTAGANGHVHIFDTNGILEKAFKAHEGEVTSIAHESGKLFTGGKDNKLCIFKASNMEHSLEKTIDLDGSFPKGIDYLNDKILVGLRNGKILEITEGSQKVLLNTHFDGEAWGLDINPESNSVYTVGDDNKILQIDYKQRKIVSEGKLSENWKPKNAKRAKEVTASTLCSFPPNQQGRAVAYSKDHGHLAVSNNMGKVSIRDARDLNKKIKTLKDAQEWNEVMKYSPCGRYLAVGSHDNAVYVYEVSKGYELYHKFNKHNSFIVSLDWSADSTYIKSVCGAYEKLFFNVQNKEHDSQGLSNTKQMQWATFSAKIGWDVEGIYPSGEDGTHINGVDRSRDMKLIATGDDFGLLNVYNYPVVSLKHKARSYCGHSEHVVRCLFTPEADKIFTIGGYDKTVIQWKRK